ncbi:succinate dehydrogenase assembly factor 2 family protein [Xanthomonas albilineans]|nr:succinate dehydrogenase assembly factor 2 family protein [Xanthomonas albilineans]
MLRFGAAFVAATAAARRHQARGDTMDDTTELKKLRWRCRRGMRELDQLFGRYLDQRWAQAPTVERGVFLSLLDCEDDKLWRWFMGYEVCPDARAADLIATIRAMPA